MQVLGASSCGERPGGQMLARRAGEKTAGPAARRAAGRVVVRWYVDGTSSPS